jgi:DNA polymerase
VSDSPRTDLRRQLRDVIGGLLEDGVTHVPRAAPARGAAASTVPATSEAPALAARAAAIERGRDDTERDPPPRAGTSRTAPSSVTARQEKRPSEPAIEPAPAQDVAVAPAHESLEAIRESLGDCRRCGLCERRRHIVFGEGSPRARVVFVGEGPGEDEDRTGRPFVGRAGELLTKMIEACGWRREEVYICNVVKCRPPGNRDPLPEEVAACRPFLERQLASIAPDVIVTLGKPAAQTLLDRPVAITRMRGRWHAWREIPLMPTYHPAYVLRRYTRETRQEVWDDLQAVHARIAERSGAGPR